MPGLEIFCRAGVIFPEAGAGDFFAGAGAGAGGEKPGVCTALHNTVLYVIRLILTLLERELVATT